ncbi:putative RNA methyltransferase [Halomonas marinisediminis]|uniref:Methyltransferase domain-containing protein n=1 Tax=Halomonas marinisediminis TaxID=2546095 RepID=A0ABY2D707_9GAMM|nr:methyltransferase domain-containing protein [Halomonas marinisediminis]TDB00429.1 methyltransferase domain-containing protein [Halomonas marinisediminis]
MSTTSFEALACPLDGNVLHKGVSTWCCAAGHSFDIARQGYVHLLPVQNKRSGDPGDSKAMVSARRRFLEAGHYRPIAEAVASAVLAEVPGEGTLCCLDAGCGEGYYLRKLADVASGIEGVPGKAPALALLGVDISKWAVLAAAKRQGSATWVVGTNAHLPVQTSCVDRVLCLFGFPVYAEFARVLRPGGELLMVEAGPNHLRELREIIYPSLKPPREGGEIVPEGFARRLGETLRFAIELEGAEPIADLLAMTPHLHRASAEGREKAAALTSLALTVDVRLTRLVRE